MNPQEFAYWLQGYFEISGSEELSKEQVEVVKKHLALVLTKVTGPTITITDKFSIPHYPFNPDTIIC